jgi:hypothetical protein
VIKKILVRLNLMIITLMMKINYKHKDCPKLKLFYQVERRVILIF